MNHSHCLIYAVYLSLILITASAHKSFNHYNHSNPLIITLSTEVDPPALVKNFKVALVTAGSIKSFVFNERSWQRYIIDPWKDNIFVFAHVVASRVKCELTNKGVDALREIATEIEISYSSATYHTLSEATEKLGGVKSCLSIAEHTKHGSILDLYTRRAKAYGMAQAYGRSNKINWDLVMFVRPDLAFYAPKLELYKYFKALTAHKLTVSTTTKQSAIIIPEACNFGGFCDGFAVGLPVDMEVYFNRTQLFHVSKWANSPTTPNESDKASKLKFHTGNAAECGRETMLMIWLLFMNNIWHANIIPAGPTFISLKTVHADTYCALSRDGTNNDPLIHWTDKIVSLHENAAKSSDFDLVASPYERCGAVYKLNATEICQSNECRCGH